MSSFYAKGVKVACETLGLIKIALSPATGMLLRGIGSGAAKGALPGAVMGGIGGFAGAPEGKGGHGFLRGAAGGAVAGGLLGSARGGLNVRGFQKANPAYMQRAETMAARNPEGTARAMGNKARGLAEGGMFTPGMAGLAGGGVAGLTTPKEQTPWDKIKGALPLEQLGLR